ncbi:hypothetical protein ACU6T4_11310 [Avibacterium paragallinarum]|uniref:hypothetical protein n=1 Tax=Avibacterium paragallinarum TaxID=728 RepID=UPI00021ACF43|nr:hypothetical protein [Avibacterium paragallinarum]AZI13301.1 hypothetical protein EIA51_00760 [Avibacterium paragallinarum]QIR12766.1 hypothetical protein HBL79_11420 [Avibacterium paragallinarum]QJE10720.1 hypothetical protein HHJ62_10735 [Avibacterium paragallinarum]QJE12913.1 hypothetical protein HHJ61_10735 [Avibacterium paragallinarum]QJE15116.1 hypothetical protein HHJ60_10765 [Avibacterium paragallinarum]
MLDMIENQIKIAQYWLDKAKEKAKQKQYAEAIKNLMRIENAIYPLRKPTPKPPQVEQPKPQPTPPKPVESSTMKTVEPKPPFNHGDPLSEKQAEAVIKFIEQRLNAAKVYHHNGNMWGVTHSIQAIIENSVNHMNKKWGKK